MLDFMLSFRRLPLTYFYKSGLSTFLQIKVKSRNKLNVEDDMRLTSPSIQPELEK